jgi:uncharacterized protein
VRFEWDEVKNRANQKAHGISFDEAQELFTSGLDYLEIFDANHSDYEDRFICIGPVRRGVILVVKTEPGEDITRIISARFASKTEKRLFEEHMKGIHE